MSRREVVTCDRCHTDLKDVKAWTDTAAVHIPFCKTTQIQGDLCWGCVTQIRERLAEARKDLE